MLSGKTAIVTGASRGIGAAIAAALAAQGASVALLYAGKTARAEEVCARCAGYGVSARSYQCDVSDFAQVKQTIAAIKKDFGGARYSGQQRGHQPRRSDCHDEGGRF